MQQKISGARFMAETLEAFGVTHVFFVPTILTGMLVEIEKRTKIKRVLTHGEKSAAYMADGYARATGRPGICLSQAIGASNLAAGLRDAWLAKSPVIAFSGSVKNGLRNKNVYQQVEDNDQYNCVTKWSARIDVIEELPYVLQQAFHISTSGSPGPVHIELAGHFGECIENAQFTPPISFNKKVYIIPPFRPNGEDGAAISALNLIKLAKKPILIAGGGAKNSNAGKELLLLCEYLQIPIATSLNAKDIIPASHPLNVGVPGLYSRKTANIAISEADLIFYVGSSTGSQVTFNWQIPKLNSKIIQLDINPIEFGRHYLDTFALLGDAKKILQDLIKISKKNKYPKREKWINRINKIRSDWLTETKKYRYANTIPIRPERIFTEINCSLPANTCVIVDTGHSGMWAATYLELNGINQKFIRAAGSLGWGLPGSIGATLARPNAPALLFIGDGGFWYHLSELETAIRWKVKLVIIINNNQSLNQEKDIYKEAYGGKLEGDHGHLWYFEDVDFVSLAKSMGAHALRVDDPFKIKESIMEGFKCRGPCVIDIRTSRDVMAPTAYTK